jgi:hypothetical protein
MKDSGEQTEGAAPPAKANQLATISERKLKANRENARKSTGPKTLRGKAYSRGNALKHGLFCTPITDFDALREDPQKYEEMLNGLWHQYQPIGKAEEIEVERIAICYWRFKRAWRYENAVNLAARRDFVRAELADQEPFCKERDKEEKAIILELKNAEKEIEDTGEISQELRQRIVAMLPEFEGLWSTFHYISEKRVKESNVSGMFQKLNPKSRSWVLAMLTAQCGIRCFEEMSNRRWTNVMETAIGQHAIPNREALDKLLRYETTIDRALNRSLDRLERLQRRRRGEPVPPPLSVRLTQ